MAQFDSVAAPVVFHAEGAQAASVVEDRQLPVVVAPRVVAVGALSGGRGLGLAQDPPTVKEGALDHGQTLIHYLI
jgi:hypothetical protein